MSQLKKQKPQVAFEKLMMLSTEKKGAQDPKKLCDFDRLTEITTTNVYVFPLIC